MNDSSPSPTGEVRQFHFTRHPEPLTRFVKIMLVVSLGTALISLWSDWLQMELLAGQYTEAEGDANDDRQGKIGLLNLAVVIVTAIAFLKWIYRANLNSRGFGARDMAFTPGWAIGCYFVPILNLLRPYQAMKEIWLVSGDPDRWQSQPVTPLLGCWWALWLGAGFLGQISFRLSLSAKTIEAIRTATNLSMISEAVHVVLCLVAWALIAEIVARQTALVEGSRISNGDSMRTEEQP